ncbi:hypothetical protein [Peredibacter starrii]|uniref:Uncharacterized protein n=1 Tax=Peredibacter starrii TaxID=28202 RepID=A0AAX4HNF0_9BACT|nr:hypothetical protein [Peredibacter starrii]WPU64766.1 hypothetical protein SOO65_18900 [Peredibacter starrii]
MKYLVVLVIVVVLVRIDVVLRLFDKASEKINSSQPETQTSEPTAVHEVVSMSQDKTLKQTSRQVFLALLDDFHNNPTKDIRETAMTHFKSHPTMFNLTLDKELEMVVFRWRDLLNNNEPEMVNFLLDLLNVLQGENQEMIKRFFSLWMEIDMQNFLTAYSKTKDTNCMVATTFGDSIPEEEKLNEYIDREAAIAKILTNDKLDPTVRALATNCQLILNVQISKMAPPPPPPGEEDQAASTEEP